VTGCYFPLCSRELIALERLIDGLDMPSSCIDNQSEGLLVRATVIRAALGKTKPKSGKLKTKNKRKSSREKI
jgi:hypothetical protein